MLHFDKVTDNLVCAIYSLLKYTFYGNRVSLNIDLSSADDVIWFSTCKNTRRDVACEVQPRLPEVGMNKYNSGNEVHSNKVNKCGSLLIFTKVPLL